MIQFVMLILKKGFLKKLFIPISNTVLMLIFLSAKFISHTHTHTSIGILAMDDVYNCCLTGKTVIKVAKFISAFIL
jgi:hypothetical protein